MSNQKLPYTQPLQPGEDAPSISTRANLRVVNDPTVLARQSVSVSMDLFMRLFPGAQHDEPLQIKNRFVLLQPTGVPDYFPCFNIYKVAAIHDDLPNLVTITNHANFSRFGPNFTAVSCVIQSIHTSAIPVLDKVFVLIPGPIYDIFSMSPPGVVKEKFISEYISSNGGVVSQNDLVSALNGCVNLCEPFYQGLVSEATSVVFVKGTSGKPNAEHEARSEADSAEADSEAEANSEAGSADSAETGSEADIDLSQYLLKSVVLDSLPKPSGRRLRIRLLPKPILVPQVSAEDTELYAFVTNQDLSRLGFAVFSGDLVTLRVAHQSLVVKLFTVLEPNLSFPAQAIYLSPLLLINLEIPANGLAHLEPYSEPGSVLHEVLPLASSVTVSRMVSSITMDKTFQQSFFAELKASFHSKFKCFRKGDVFPVCIDSMLSKVLFDVSVNSHQAKDAADSVPDSAFTPTGNPDSVAWFKVTDITGKDTCELGQYRIDPSKTALTSSGVEFEPLPKNSFHCWVSYLDLPPVFDYRRAVEANAANFKFAQELLQVIKTGAEFSTKLEIKTTVLLHSMSRGLGKTMVVRSVALELGLNLIELDAMDFVRPGAELKTVGLLTGKMEKQLNGQLDCEHPSNYNILFIKHIENLCIKTDPNEQGANSSMSLALKVIQAIQEFLGKYRNTAFVASCNDIDKVSDNFRQMITFEIGVGVPSEPERLEIFRHLLRHEAQASSPAILPEFFRDSVEFRGRPDVSQFRVTTRRDVKAKTLAVQSAGLTPRDLISIIKKTKHQAINRCMSYSRERGIGLEEIFKIGNGGYLLLIPEDFEKAINEARSQFSDSIGAPRIPNVKWEDIGGLDLVKDEILDTIDLPLKHPELFHSGLKKRSGILFYGPPGTGKTLLAKAIATNFSLNFFSVKGPELLNMYIGESEANVRRVFQRARDAKPCVIFFDELDSVAPKRGNQGDSGGVMDRIVSQLLAELDGMSGGESNGDGVFVVGATNRPDLLDEALLRPGRFDKMLYLGISDTNEKQAKVLEALTRKFQLHDDVDLQVIAEKCTFTFTGADFYALCSDSMLNAMTRTANAVDSKLKKLNAERLLRGEDEVSSRWWFDNVASPEDIKVLVTMEDFRKAQSELAPSVSAEELEHYLRVKENFEGKKETQERN